MLLRLLFQLDQTDVHRSWCTSITRCFNGLNFPLRRAQLQQSSSAAMEDFLDEAFEFPVVKAGGWGRF